jgi:hypothetical protein
MINLCKKGYDRRLEGIVYRELDLHLEITSGIWTIGRTKDSATPFEEVVSSRSCATICGRVFSEIINFFLNATEGHD